MDSIRVAKLFPDAKLPTRKHSTDAGMDLYCFHGSGGTFTYALKPGRMAIYGTGVAVEIPEGFVGQVWPKSRSNFLIGGGIIDAGYQGEIKVKIFNTSDQPIVFNVGDAIAQLLILPVKTPEPEEVSYEEFCAEKTDRGATGGIISQLELFTSPVEEIS